MAAALGPHGTRPGASFALIANMAVRPEFRRRGLATAMLVAAEAQARDRFRGPRPTTLLLLVYRYFAANRGSDAGCLLTI
jgi:GNAT superfamily N-acetyltransferase